MAFTYGTVNKCTSADGTANNIYEVRLGYELQSQDLVNNTSTFKLQLEARSTDSRYKPYGYNQTTTIDGTTYSAKTFDFRSTNTWQVFGTKTLTNVSHNADGTYSVSKSGYFTTTLSGARPKRGDASVIVTLPTIPRASSITVSDANIGSATNIVINKASSSFTTTLYYKASGQSSFTKIVDKTANQVYGWTVPTSFYSLIPNQRNITCQFYAETYSGSTLIGTSSTVSATFKANVYPTINSITKQTIDQKTYDLTGNHNTIIKGVSTLQVQVNASAGTGASIDHYVIGGASTTSSTKTITQASSNTYSVSVYDTRGEPPTTTSFTMPNAMINYVPLTINANIRRNQPTDGIVKINLSGNYFNASFGNVSNTLTVEYRYKVSGSSTWDQDWTSSGVTVTKSGNTYTASKDLSGMTYTNSYQFEVRATDQIGTQTITGITVTKGIPIFNWDNDEFAVNVDAYTKGKLYLGQQGSQDYSVAGFDHDEFGNWKHKRNSTTDTWSIKSNDGNNQFTVFPETGDLKPNSILAKTSRPSTPDFNHQYPDNKASARFDIATSSMDSSGNKPSHDGFINTYFWDNSGAYDAQIAIPNGSDGHLQFRTRNAGNWQNNWKDIAFTNDIPPSDFMVATRSTDQTISGNNTVTKYQLNTNSASNGSKLTFNSSNNSIDIGSGVSYVEISSQIYIYTRGANSLKTFYIYKNENQVARFSQPMDDDYWSIAIPAFIISVQQGDKITMRFRSGSGNTVLGGANSNAGVNFLTVKVIK